MQQAMPSANALATKLLGFRDWGIYFQTHFKSEFVAAQCLDWRNIKIATTPTYFTGAWNLGRLDNPRHVLPKKKNRPD